MPRLFLRAWVENQKRAETLMGRGCFCSAKKNGCRRKKRPSKAAFPGQP